MSYKKKTTGTEGEPEQSQDQATLDDAANVSESHEEKAISYPSKKKVAELSPEESNKRNEESAKKLSTMVEMALKVDAKKMAPLEMPDKRLTPFEIDSIIKSLGDTMGLEPVLAIIAVYLLFLKGAANEGTPLTMDIGIFDQDGRWVIVRKYDLMMAYNKITNNKFLRRLAESLAIEISTFAEQNMQKGDLAGRINNRLIAAKEMPLTAKEKAWCSSFCQVVPNLESYSSSRLSQLLAEDFSLRFDKLNQRGKKAEKPSPAGPYKKKDKKKEGGSSQPQSKGKTALKK